MNQMTFAGKAPKLSFTHTVALYDPKDGRVHHMHHVMVLEGAEHRPQHAIEVEAKANATRLGHNVSGLAALHVQEFKQHKGHYRVDLQRHCLIES